MEASLAPQGDEDIVKLGTSQTKLFIVRVCSPRIFLVLYCRAIVLTKPEAGESDKSVCLRLLNP